MKKIFLLAMMLLIIGPLGYSQGLKPLIVYSEGNGAFVPSGWMGDNSDIQLDNQHTKKPSYGKYCQKWTYTAKGGQKNGWAGVYWQYPANNWGNKKGKDLKGYKRVTFWARGETGREVITVKAGGIKGDYSDTFTAEYGKLRLGTTWKKYFIDLSTKDLSNVIGGFCWAVDSKDNPKGCTFYFDDIRYEK